MLKITHKKIEYYINTINISFLELIKDEEIYILNIIFSTDHVIHFQFDTKEEAVNIISSLN